MYFLLLSFRLNSLLQPFEVLPLCHAGGAGVFLIKKSH